MTISKFVLVLACLLVFLPAVSQTTRQTGLRDRTPAVFAFTNATIVTAPGVVVEGATLVVRNGLVEAVGANVRIPADATVHDLSGKYIFPGFIDAYAVWNHYDTLPPRRQGATYWNANVNSHFNMAEVVRNSERDAALLRSQGFVAANLVPGRGIMRGQGAVLTLGQEQPAMQVVNPASSQVVDFMITRRAGRGSPTSVMGAIALTRQALHDAEWYRQAHASYARNPRNQQRPEENISLGALVHAREIKIPFIVETPDEILFLRIHEINREFGLNLWIRASGYEYRRLDAIAQTGLPVIVPVNFPAPPAVEAPEDAMNASLEDLRHWYLAPENPAKLAEKGLNISLTAYGLSNTGDFLNNVRKAIERGLSRDAALAALTVNPARMLRMEQKYGTLAAGMSASFFISSGHIFEQNAIVEQVWIDGNQYYVQPPREEPRGTWTMKSQIWPEPMTLSLTGEPNRLEGRVEHQGKTMRLQGVRYDNARLFMQFPGDTIGIPGTIRLSAHLQGDELKGLAEKASGQIFSWSGSRTAPFAREERNRAEPKTRLNLEPLFPSIEFGVESKPVQPEHLLVRNAAIWTQGPQGRLEDADMLVQRGKIVRVGHNLPVPRGAVVVDATGLHVTPGLIDPHLHTAILGGVNETGDAITSETRIMDVFNPDDIWTYRLLAGGMTAGTLYHGSANPIGGTNLFVKLRWGALPSEMIVEEALPGLKFALGENVKRTPNRYPNTRLGVEQIIKDALIAALEYEQKHKNFNPRSGMIPPRRDLQLESILEVLRGKRGSHVHAYRADEMLMMMRLAEEFGFRVTSFEHAVEGYKIARELKEHGAIPVVWTDWTSFKVEAYDGIRYNAALLDHAGVTTTLHSDHTQLSTRMNWEAGKMVGHGITEEEALNLITLNPARLMGVSHRMGSLEAGKDADFVIWSGDPLSAFTIARQTWIDGRKYFDREEDLLMREALQQERAMLIRRILLEPANVRQQATPPRGGRPQEFE